MVLIYNEYDPDWFWICPKCGTYWAKRGPEPPIKCPRCQVQMSKFAPDEIDLKIIRERIDNGEYGRDGYKVIHISIISDGSEADK